MYDLLAFVLELLELLVGLLKPHVQFIRGAGASTRHTHAAGQLVKLTVNKHQRRTNSVFITALTHLCSTPNLTVFPLH